MCVNYISIFLYVEYADCEDPLCRLGNHQARLLLGFEQ